MNLGRSISLLLSLTVEHKFEVLNRPFVILNLFFKVILSVQKSTSYLNIRLLMKSMSLTKKGNFTHRSRWMRK